MFENLIEDGMINPISVEVLEEACIVLDSFGYDEYRYELELIFKDKFEGDDCTSDTFEVLLNAINNISKDIGIVFAEEGLRIRLDFINAFTTVTNLDDNIKEDLLESIGMEDSNIEIINKIVLPYMLDNTSELEFVLYSVSDGFIEIIDSLLRTNNIDSIEDAYEYSKILTYLKDRFTILEEDAIWLKSVASDFYGDDMVDILMGTEFNMNRVHLISLLLISSTRDSMVSGVTKYYSFVEQKDKELYDTVYKLAGEIDEKE